MHLERLKAMIGDDGGTWDLSPNDVSAISWAIRQVAVAGKLKAACEAMLNDNWADNCEQYAHGRKLAIEAVTEANSVGG